jgi:integrase
MNHTIEKVLTPKGELRFELRVWGRASGSDLKRRFKSKDEALKAIKTLYAKEDLVSDPHDPAFVSEFEYWLKSKSKSFAPGWQKNIPSYWAGLKQYLEHRRVSEVTKRLLREIETDLLEKGNSQKTVNLKLGFINAVLNHSLKMERITTHKLLGWKRTRPVKKLPRFWSQRDAETFLARMSQRYPPGSKDRWVFCVYLVALSTGLRAGEIWALRWKRLRPESGLIEIREQFDTTKKIFRKTKGSEERDVPLDAGVWREIASLSTNKCPDSLIFNHHGKAICHRAFTRRYDRDLNFSSLHKIAFHGFRHTAATLMLAAGVDIKTLQEVLGHEDVKTTMGYVHALKEKVRNVPSLYRLNIPSHDLTA